MLALNFDDPYVEWSELKRFAAAQNGWDIIDADHSTIDDITNIDGRIDAIMPTELELNDYAIAVERMLYQRFSSAVWTVMWDSNLEEFVTWRPWCISCGESRAENPTDYCRTCMEQRRSE
jgi:hypothetical protein